MKNKILELIKSSATNEEDYKSLVSIFNLHEQLQYATNIKQMAEDIFSWLNKEFNIDNLTFSLFDVNKNYKEKILVKGEEFYLDADECNNRLEARRVIWLKANEDMECMEEGIDE